MLYPIRYKNLREEIITTYDGDYVKCHKYNTRLIERLSEWLRERLGVERNEADLSDDEIRGELQDQLSSRYVASGEIFEERVDVFDGELFGFVDTRGEVVIEHKYISVEPFREGRAVVQSPNGWGLIDLWGEEVIPTIYESIEYNPNCGVSAVRDNGKWGYISYRGEVLTPFVDKYPDLDRSLRDIVIEP